MICLTRSFLRIFALFWLPLAGYLVFLQQLSLQTDLPVPSFSFSDKLLHAAAFAVLGFLWARALNPLFNLGRVSLIGVAFWGTFLYAVLDEFLVQAGTPGRFPSWGDLAADAVGGILGGCLFLLIKKRLRSSPITG